MNSLKVPAVPATLALTFFAVALFFPALFQGKILAPLDITANLLAPWNETANSAKPHNHNPSDAVTQYLPYRIFAEQSLREDGYIGWNPYEMGGYSLAANTMALPGSWPVQLHRFLPFKDAWNLGIFAEFLIAGTGMLLFLRSRKLPWIPCLIGGVAFMFNAQFIVWIYHRWALGSFCWMPWILWSYGNGFSEMPIQRQKLLLPGFLALAILGGSLQHVAFVVLACGCMAVADFDFRRPLRNTSSLTGWSLVFLLALGITAFSLLPQISGYLSNISIGHVRGGIGYKDGFLQPFLHLLLIPLRIWPWLAGDPQTIDGWRILKSGFMELNYIGTIPMLLGIAGIFWRRMPCLPKWLMVVGLSIPLTPLVGPLYHRVELLFILGASWMSAEMLARLPEFSMAFSWRRWLVGMVTAIGVVLLFGTCLPSGIRAKLERLVISKSVEKSGNSQFGADKEWIASRASEWTDRFSIIHPSTAWVFGLLCIGTAGITLAADRRPVKARAGQWMILCATSFELATLFQTWCRYSDASDLRPSHSSIEFVRKSAGPHRVLQSSPGTKFAEIFATPNLLASYGIPSIDAYESIQYRSPLVTLRDLPSSDQLTLAGVGIAIETKSSGLIPGLESWPVIKDFGKYAMRKNPDVPAPICASSGHCPETTGDILAAIKIANPVSPILQTVNSTSFVIPDGCTWVRLAHNWHEGWRWRTPGRDWQPFRNGPDTACWIDSLPGGSSLVEVRFFPRSRVISALSIGAVVVWMCLIAALVFRSKRLTDAP